MPSSFLIRVPSRRFAVVSRQDAYLGHGFSPVRRRPLHRAQRSAFLVSVEDLTGGQSTTDTEKLERRTVFDDCGTLSWQDFGEHLLGLFFRASRRRLVFGSWNAVPTPPEARQRAATTYNAAADHYDEAPLSFWDYFGERTVEKIALSPGDRVLDACCGAGASALPAAQRVRPRGEVLGIDLAERLIERGRAKAQQCGLENIEFRVGDILALNEPDESFDAVVCVFGIFFIPDMPGAVRELWRLLRAGGKLAITTWGPNLFEPANDAFWREVQKIRPDLHKAFNPWDRINDPAGLRAMLREAGVEPHEVIAESRRHPLRGVEDWWTIALGSGYRGTIEQLTVTEREEIRSNNLSFLRRESVTSLGTNAVYAVARKQLRR